ncbi:hypothetical protein GMDG_05528 [Pseudogymnoascus destructans 20631-21]|uniref:DUF5672 domain-containing protein n=1 Tax=Pseudogymnoascus destructans (strain ATCC MYA-4855 / 20631-21) TaxID=658429 RepID=L8FPL4_PSED2|nr:hypothetical protein GMDG_05528 [Pseudogymnoascus destructans 20631-21]
MHHYAQLVQRPLHHNPPDLSSTSDLNVALATSNTTARDGHLANLACRPAMVPRRDALGDRGEIWGCKALAYAVMGTYVAAHSRACCYGCFCPHNPHPLAPLHPPHPQSHPLLPPRRRLLRPLPRGQLPFNASRVGLLIENRPNPILAPLMLHFMTVVPPEWRFRFMGSPKSVASINQSHAIREQVRIGKLDLTLIPENMTTSSQEEISVFLTTLWVYEQLLRPAEHLLVFQTDSMLCANARQSINEWLDFDWVGAPWHPDGKWGGNGGLSLRRVAPIIEILKHQVRGHRGGPEDVWLSERLSNRPGAKMANGSLSLTFSGEMHTGRPEHVRPSDLQIPEEDREKRPAGGG